MQHAKCGRTHNLPSRFYNDPGGTLFGRDADGNLQNPFHKSSYAAPANSNRSIITHVVFKADMREITRGTIVHMERTASRDPSGINGFDGRQTMLPPSVIAL